MPSDDLRPLLLEAEAEVRRARLRREVPAGLGVVVLGAVLLAVADRAGMRWSGLALLTVGALTLVAATARHRTRHLPGRACRVAGVPALELRRRPLAFWAGMGVLAVVVAVPTWVAADAVADGRVGAALVAALVAAGLGWPLAVAAAGRYVPGAVVLTPTGVRYRHLGLESWTSWEQVGVVEVDEPHRTVTLHTYPGGAVRHRHRARPHGQARPPATEMVLELRDWGPLATDVGRLLMHYAEHPADRDELGSPAAVGRWSALPDQPVHRRRDTWFVGDPDGRSEPDPHEGGWAPLWADSVDAIVQRSIRATASTRLRLALGALLLAPTALALAELPEPVNVVSGGAFGVAALAALVLAFVDPAPPGPVPADAAGAPAVAGPGVTLRRSPVRLRLWAVVCLCLAVGSGLPLVLAAPALPVPAALGGLVLVLGFLALPLLVVTGAVVPRQLHLDETGVAYRSGLTRHCVAWHQVGRVDTVRDDVVRLGLRDGRAVRIDLAGTGGRGLDVALLLSRFAAQGGPRGQTRDLEAVRQALRGPWGSLGPGAA